MNKSHDEVVWVEEDIKSIEKEEIELYSTAKIQQYKSDVAFISLMSGVLDGLYIVPNFQRTYRWTTEQVEDLATSLVRGMPIPPIYTYRNDKGQLELLDGQQRLISLLLYFKGKELVRKRNGHIDFRNAKNIKDVLDNEYIVKDHEYFMRFMQENKENNLFEEKVVNISYNALQEAMKRKVDYTNITVVEIVVDDPKYQLQNLYKIFANLNSGGTQLSKQELRNGIYGSAFYDMLFDINDHSKEWRDLYGKEDKQAKDIECLLRFCAISANVTYKNGAFHVAPFKNYTQLLNDFSKSAINFTPSEIDYYKSCLIHFISHCPAEPKKITLWEALFVVCNKIPEFEEITPQMYFNILENEEYKRTVKSGTAGKNEIETRLRVVYNELSEHYRKNC